MSDFETEFARRNALSHALAMARCLQDRSFPDMRQTAEESLIRHLPSLRPEDAAWINREEVRSLLQALDPARPAVTVAILGALGQVDDRRAIRYVEELFGRLSQTNDASEILVRDAAYDCLVRLREYAARAKQSNVLLRGSQSPTGGPQSIILLRAASKTGSNASIELLRPSEAAEVNEAPGMEKHDDPSL